MKLVNLARPFLICALVTGGGVLLAPAARAQAIAPVPFHWMDGVANDVVSVTPNPLRIAALDAQTHGLKVNDLRLVRRVQSRLERERFLNASKVKIEPTRRLSTPKPAQER